ncbi:Nicotinamidase-related amidase [Pseudobutyrivibrio sp. YE44]|uniref:cysteine hydrolase family protein n=1 Tax=Pseudobutyrivibrio sp. YE44 TaxID=1520802 RepID=UPI000892370F|nr:cysteine hydrolase [Pseudobutyrivibrio sp. YE44]SDB24070.1 Nicotinamidase-related amidase [Pseudobutyrivibrio sp. YE44]
MSKVLVVIDMQKDFITGALRNEEGIAIVPYVKEKIEAAKAAGNTIIFTRDTHGDDYMETEEGANLPVPHCIKGTEGWQIIPELNADENADYIIDKETFGSKELAELMAENEDNIDEVEFIGVCTDICVISNVLLTKAMIPNKKIYVDAKGCAGVTPAAHATALEAMKACHIKIEN